MTTSIKTCFKCHAEKPITGFYVHPAMGDGRLNKCKECTRKDVAENYRANLDYYREYDRSRNSLPHRVSARKEYAKTPEGRLAFARAHKKQTKLYPEKAAARNALSNAVRDGRVLRPDTCQQCGKSGSVEGHHHDYSKALDVHWLCCACHRAEHGQEAA